MQIHPNILVASGLAAALVLGIAGAVTAAPALHSTAVLKDIAPASRVTVSDRDRDQRHRARQRPQQRPDNVGSIVHDGIGYGYNRFTGQRYMSCMIDEGYGRVTPCDAGQGGGGGGLN